LISPPVVPPAPLTHTPYTRTCRSPPPPFYQFFDAIFANLSTGEGKGGESKEALLSLSSKKDKKGKKGKKGGKGGKEIIVETDALSLAELFVRFFSVIPSLGSIIR